MFYNFDPLCKEFSRCRQSYHPQENILDYSSEQEPNEQSLYYNLGIQMLPYNQIGAVILSIVFTLTLRCK
jgi:hypothetical protein